MAMAKVNYLTGHDQYWRIDPLFPVPPQSCPSVGTRPELHPPPVGAMCPPFRFPPKNLSRSAENNSA